MFLIIQVLFSCNNQNNNSRTRLPNQNTKSLEADLDSLAFLTTYIKVYGLLKYYHPKYLSGKISIDSAFLHHYNRFTGKLSKELFNSIVDSLLVSNNELDTNKVVFDTSGHLFSWIVSTNTLSDTNKARLFELSRNKNTRLRQHYVKNFDNNIGNAVFINEEINNDTTYFPDYPIRVLALAKYWNMLNYFYPFKDSIENFDNGFIKNYILKLQQCHSSEDYQLTILEMTTDIHDSHIYITYNQFLNKLLGENYLPFKTDYYDSNFYISKVISKSFGVKVGDRLININGNNIRDLTDSFNKYIAPKNSIFKNYIKSLLLSHVTTDSVSLKVIRNNDTVLVKTSSVSYYVYYRRIMSVKHKAVIKEKNRIYLNTLLVKDKDVDYAFNNFDTVILDLRMNIRTGLRFTVANHLFEKPVKWCNVKMPDLNHPGFYHFSDDFLCGEINSNPFKGCVYVLIDENTISQGEASCMMFSLFKNTTIIGRNSRGAVGNVTSISLPGKIKTRFTGVAVFDLKGTSYHSVGITPDIYIKRNLNSILSNEDEVLDYLKINYK